MMNESEARQLCLDLMRADSEDEVVRLLVDAGFWDDDAAWRYYGDYENNYNTIGNQQGRPEAALVEKLVNAVDARLMNECLVRGIDPEGPDAPRSIREAVAQFFDGDYHPESPHAGQVKNWSDSRRREVAHGITLAATGAGARTGNPCFTICDCGEGQTPERFPDTFLSLTKSNKVRIPFVQGKFNMGGTGVFEFCGKRGLQLIVSRRNPKILDVWGRSHPSDSKWGFTIVRREDPKQGRRSSTYTYLAPVDSDKNPCQGGVLRFTAPTMPIFPEGRTPYCRECEWGTLIKLYEYAASGFKSNILMKDGLLSRVDLLLPELALPVRLHECRETYKGHTGSFDTTVSGVSVRLEDDRANNLEEGFPSSCIINASGERMTATIYAFKKGKAETYRKHEGVIFTVNGQTHGHLTADFFARKAVGLSYLADSLLVMVDCTGFTPRARELLFMTSRDRLRSGDFRAELEQSLELILKQHKGLRDLKERRRREQTEAKLADSKPLEQILEALLKKSPTLANLFLHGSRATNPFKTFRVRQEEKPYQGKRFPTFFKFKGYDYGRELVRETPINMRSRIIFETDAANDYFSRASEKGEFCLYRLDGDHRVPQAAYVGPNLHNGIATLSVPLPDNCQVGDVLNFVAVVSDPSRVDPFENRFSVRVKNECTPSGGTSRRRTPPSREPGDEREISAGISLPNIIEVFEKDWEKYKFDKLTALRIKHTGTSDENGDTEDTNGLYDFYINLDNLYLQMELKAGHRDSNLTRARFKYGMVLIGLALLHDAERERITRQRKHVACEDVRVQECEEDNIEQRVEKVARAIAPILLPMIESLADLEEEPPVVLGLGEGT